MSVPHTDSAIADLFKAARTPQGEPLRGRDLVSEAVLGSAFLAAALAIGLSFEADRAWPAAHVLALTILFAVALRVRFDVGAGWTQPVQLAFVPMLLLLPTPWVPLLVLAGFLLERVPEFARSGMHPSRLLLLPNNAWFSLGPTLVLVAAGAQTPDWAHWPIYLLALLAQFAVDVVLSELREWLGRGIAPKLHLRVIGVVPMIDGLLSPVGVLAAFASQEFEFAYLLLVPPAALLVVYARERAQRVQAAIGLVESEREALRSREALVAGASHEILTPLSVVSGLANRLSGDDLDPARRSQAVATLRREVILLRHLSRQFVDYTRVKAGHPLTVRPRPTPVAEVLQEVAGAFGARADVRVDLNGVRPAASVDPDRLQQMVMVLVSNAVKHAPGTPVRLTAHENGHGVEVVVTDRGPGIPEGERRAIFEELDRGGSHVEGAGIGLYLCRALARAHGGDVRVEPRDGPGATFVISLPAA